MTVPVDNQNIPECRVVVGAPSPVFVDSSRSQIQLIKSGGIKTQTTISITERSIPPIREDHLSSPKVPGFQYSPLPTQSVRMLILFPGTAEESLHGELEIVDVANAGFYEPLSYVWGDASRTHSITCNNASLGLSANLCHGLQQLRLPDKSRRVWVDQICINQSDLDERNEQLRYMNAIYQNASHVLVWLGKDESGVSATSFALVEELSVILTDEEKLDAFRMEFSSNLEDKEHKDWSPLHHITTLSWVR
jgi:hypothetical protein